MNVIFYTNNSFDNVLNKNLAQIFNLDLNLRFDFNLHSTDIKIIYTGDIDVINYCYISEVDRFYFIESIEKVTCNLYTLKLVCDYLMTFKSEINSTQFDFKTPIGSGDFGKVDVSSNGAFEIMKVESDVVFTSGNTYLLNVVGDFN